MAVRTYGKRAASFVADIGSTDAAASQSSQGSSRSSSQSSIERRVGDKASSAFDFPDECEAPKRSRSMVRMPCCTSLTPAQQASPRSLSFSNESSGTPKLRRSSSGNSKTPSLEQGSASFSELKEHGAHRTLLDQVEYALEGLDASQGLQTRRSCALELATLCATNTELSFLFRAHGMFDRTMELLRSCNDDKVLWIAAATIMYFLFQDQLNSEYVSTPSLSLLVSFLSQGSGGSNAPKAVTYKLGRTPDDYIESLHALYSKEENRFGRDATTIEPCSLALVTLANLSSHQPTLRESLRTCGILDVICHRLSILAEVPSLATLSGDSLEDASLLLSILENVTFMNRTTQEYLSSLPQLLPNVITFVSRALLTLGPTPLEGILYNSLLLATRALVNLTHKNVAAARVFGLTASEGLGTVMTLIRRLDKDGDPSAKMLSIGLLVNVLEESKEQRTAVRDMGEVQYLVGLYQRSHDAMLMQPGSEFEFVTSYMALLLGCLVRDEETNRATVLRQLTTHNFDDLITRIGYFIAHQLDNGVLSREAHRSYVEILEVLDPQAAAEARHELAQEMPEQ